MEERLKTENHKTAEEKNIARVVRNWRAAPLIELVKACKSIYGANHLLSQRREVVGLAKSRGVRPGDLADEMIGLVSSAESTTASCDCLTKTPKVEGVQTMQTVRNKKCDKS